MWPSPRVGAIFVGTPFEFWFSSTASPRGGPPQYARELQTVGSRGVQPAPLRAGLGCFPNHSALESPCAKRGAMQGLPLGSLAKSHLGSHPWSDGYPALPSDVEELEHLLSFAQAETRIDDFVARLKGRPKQRDETLNELRVGLGLKALGYRIVGWEPRGQNRRKLEYSIQRDAEDVVFVEVKSPGWEGELAPEERRRGRANQPKYMLGEHRGGPLATWQDIRTCVTKAYPKFAPGCQNLLVIADDFRVPLDDLQMKIALYNPDCPDYGPGCFASREFEDLGGAARLQNELLSSRAYFSVCYRIYGYPNPYALKQLPKEFSRCSR